MDKVELKQLLENVILNWEELEKIKEGIVSICKVGTDNRFLREFIIKARFRMVNDLLKLFPYYNRLKCESCTMSEQKEVLQKELEEKGGILEQVDKRIQKVYEKLIQKHHSGKLISKAQ